MPIMNWVDSIPPNKVRDLTIQRDKNQILIEWKEPDKNSQGESGYGYVIYRFINENVNLDNPKNILKIIQPKKEKFIDKIDKDLFGEITYVVTALDRHHNESDFESIKIIIK